MCIRCELIKVYSTPQPNRLLIHKPTRISFIVPEEVVMQPRLTVDILVLQAEGLVCSIRYLSFFFQTTPTCVVTEPNQIAVLLCHLSWETDLVTVEVVGQLSAFSIFGCPIADLCQRFVRTAHALRQNWRFCACYGLLALVIQTTLADYIYNKSMMSKAKISFFVSFFLSLCLRFNFTFLNFLLSIKEN